MKSLDTLSLKRYIYDNKKIDYILEKIGCHHIQYHPLKDYYSCGNYNGDNPSSINIYNTPYLHVKNWTREKEFDKHADIYTLVQYNKNLSFTEAVKYIHSLLGLEYKWTKPTTKIEVCDPWGFARKHKYGSVDVKEIEKLRDEEIDYYIPMIHEDWFRDGIIPKTRKKFDLCYSYRRHRVMIPLRMWNTGELLGFNSRTTIKNYAELGIKKYFITPSYPKQLNLYGLYENMDSIKQAGYVVVYESERSVLKRDSRNDSTGVALSGHIISDEQVAILKHIDGVREIIISMDKDVSLNEVRCICEKFNGYNVSYTYDKWDLLSEKDSLADAPKKIFNFLFKHRVKYDEAEHNKYQASLKKK